MVCDRTKSSVDFICVIAALLFFVGNMLKLIFFGKEFGRQSSQKFNWMEYKELNPDHIIEEWNFRIENKSHLMAAGIITSLAWFFLCFPMLQLVYVLNAKHSESNISRNLWLHVGIIILTLGGAFTEWIANFLYMGSTLACEMMITSFNLQTWTDVENDNIGYRSLEVAYIAIRGMKFWVDAFEWIALSFIMLFTFMAVRRYQKKEVALSMLHQQYDTTDDDDDNYNQNINNDPYRYFSRMWNALGLFIGFLSLLDFITEILRTVNFRLFSKIAFIYGSMNRTILLPVWLLVLAWNLPHALHNLELKNKQHQKNVTSNSEVEPAIVVE